MSTRTEFATSSASGTALAAGLGALAVVLGAAAVRRRAAQSDVDTPAQRPSVRAARRLNRAAGLISTSALLDSAVEHYRGSFHNKAMFTPLVASAATLGVSVHGTLDARPVAHGIRDSVYATAALAGIVGTGFHLYNIVVRRRHFSWQNLFYGAPLGAPASVALAGLLGYYSERLRESDSPGRAPRVFELPAGRALAALAAIGLVATSAEAGLLHFRGAYHDPFMYAPVTVPPIAAVLLAEVASTRPRQPRAFARRWLRLTALMGLIGPAFHAFGVSRNMGGWKNWRQNVLNGPPIPAPPSFTGLALAGLAAIGLIREHPDA